MQTREEAAEQMASERGPTDQLLRRLLAAAAGEVSVGQVARLLGEARAEAETEVKAVLKSAIKASLLRRATEQIESGTASPPPPPPPPQTSAPASVAPQ